MDTGNCIISLPKVFEDTEDDYSSNFNFTRKHNKSVKNNGSEQEVELWEGYIREISGREFYLKDDVKTNIDTTIYLKLVLQSLFD